MDSSATPAARPANRIRRIRRRTRDARRNRAFSLIELMVVITVIGLLVATVGVKLFGVLTKGKRTKVLSDIADIDKALKMYRLEKHRYPTELRDLLEPTRDFPDGFLDRVPKDPWDNEYIYERQQRKYLIKSLGADGQNGGEGEDEDISNQDRDDE